MGYNFKFPAGVETKAEKKAYGKAQSKAAKSGTTKAQRKEQIRLRTIENASRSRMKKGEKQHACQHCHKNFREKQHLQNHLKDAHPRAGGRGGILAIWVVLAPWASGLTW